MEKISYRLGIGALTLILLLCVDFTPLSANPKDFPFAPGEKLEYQLRWGNVPAGSALLEVLPVKTINGRQAYHFVMTAASNTFVDIFYKVRDRIDAFANVEMTRSVHYAKKSARGKPREK